MPDSELSVLQEKVERLTRDRNIAQRQAARDNLLLQEFKTQVEEYSKLLAGAEARIQQLESQLPKPRKGILRTIVNRFR